jgi:hypothetical protein
MSFLMDTPASLLERLRQPAEHEAWSRFEARELHLKKCTCGVPVTGAIPAGWSAPETHQRQHTMKVFLSIIYCAVIGALIPGILAFLAFILVDIFVPKDSDEGKAWLEFAVLMTGLGCAGIGFVLGAMYRAIRALIDAGKVGETAGPAQ